MTAEHVELSRDLGLFDITMIGVGAMIGAGIRESEPTSEVSLQELGILRPAADRHTGPLQTVVNKGRLLVVGVLALIAVALTYLGGGELWTWIGSLAFLVLLFIFTWISIRPSADPMPE